VPSLGVDVATSRKTSITRQGFSLAKEKAPAGQSLRHRISGPYCSLDDLVGLGEERGGYLQAKRPCGSHVEHKLELVGLLENGLEAKGRKAVR
jgi:hypothetical protein